jgi:hypothetical protein
MLVELLHIEWYILIRNSNRKAIWNIAVVSVIVSYDIHRNSPFVFSFPIANKGLWLLHILRGNGSFASEDVNPYSVVFYRNIELGT